MFAPWFPALLVLAQTPSHAPDRMPMDDGMRIEGVSAEYLRPPAGVSLDQFARETLNASGLVGSEGRPPSEVAAPSGYRALVIVSGDGRSAFVSYRPATHDGVCVMRASVTGTGPASRRAAEWCAARFGIELTEPLPLIANGTP